MKKFLVGILSLFLLMGASVLAACGSSKVDLTLSRDSVSILYDKDNLSQEIVVATVSGGKNVSVTASVSNSYENIISAKATSVSSNKWEITITALNEGQGEVVVMTNQGNVSKIISVDVYSEVTSMTQNQSENVVRKNYALRGGSVALIEENLLSFQPSNLSRRQITWSIANEIEGATIEGTNLIIDQSYLLDTIVLTATTEKNVTTNVVLPVIDKIEQELYLSWSYSLNSQFDLINEDNNTFRIVPNEPSDEHYTGYLKLNYDGDLVITPVIVDQFGQANDALIVNKNSEDENGYPIYEVYIDREKPNINKNYTLYFEIGYEDYDYNIDTFDNVVIIEAREIVNDVEIRGENNELIANKNTMTSAQTLYSEYLNSLGKMFNIEILPTTVENYSNKYYISVAVGSVGEAIVPNNECPVKIYYQDKQNNNIIQEIVLTWDEEQGAYISRADANIDYKTIYLKAHSNLLQQNVNNVSITFTSVDNTNISSTVQLELVKSVSQEQFVFENADFRVDSSQNTTSTIIEKVFTLFGQTDVDGISLEVNSENVKIDGPIKVSNTTDSVTFKILLTLNTNSYGITALDKYRFIHENGLVSDYYDINIFLPLTEAAVVYDQGSNATDSVTYNLNNNLIYFENGTTDTSTSSLSNIMIKNGSTVPVLYRYNSSNGNNAVAKIKVNYFDLDYIVEGDQQLTQEEKNEQINEFKNLINTAPGISQIINGAYANQNVSKYAYFSSDNKSIITSNVGFTYAVITFTGAGNGANVDENGNINIIRIVLIESYVAPSNLTVTPSSDNEITLYSSNTVSSNDKTLTRKTITIDFKNSNVTYIDLTNFEFVSTIRSSTGEFLMGNASLSGNSITWENGRYLIENIIVNDYSLSFDIVSSSLKEQSSFSDILEIHYKLSVIDSTGTPVFKDVMWTNLSINIKNAQRVESLKWEAKDDEGLYFEIGDTNPQFIVLSSSPTNARNSNISYLITQEDGTVDYTNTALVTVGDYIDQNRISLSLNKNLSIGTTGYIYLIPQDAIYNNNITYYLKTEQENPTLYTVSFESLGKIYSGNMTWYDYLISNAYFISNSFESGEAKAIGFDEILLKIKINVADGRSFEHAYRIYTAEEFISIDPTKYYRLMNSIELTFNGTSINLSGGIEGRAFDDENGSVNTVTFLSGSTTFIASNSGTIRNINFNGAINSSGFVAGTNTGTIENVTIDVNGIQPSILTSTAEKVGGIVGINSGEIINCSVLGLNIDASSSSFVGGIAGENSSSIIGCKVEFYNLKTGEQEGKPTYGVNTFKGQKIGGLVGSASNNSILRTSYVYNFVKGSSPLDGSNVYSLIAQTNGTVTIDRCFAVEISSNIIGGSSVSGEYYNAYYGQDNKYNVEYYKDGSKIAIVDNLSTNYIKSGEDFLNYVNNGNPYFKDVYQSEKIEDIQGTIVTYKDNNGYYKSLEVSDNEGILFYYGIEEGLTGLSQSAINDLQKLNTINLTELIENTANISIQNLILTSSNNNILKVIGTDLIIVGTGKVQIDLYSKQDVQNSKTFYVDILNSMSNLIVSYTDVTGRENIVTNNSISYLQRSTTRNYIVTYEKPSVILGNNAEEYKLIQNNITIEATATSVGESQDLVSIETNKNVIIVNADNESGDSKISILPRIYSKNSDDTENSYQIAINNRFGRSFQINPTDGVIEFSVSEGGLSITPSINAVIRVQVITTAENDKETIIPQIRDENGNILNSLSKEDETNNYDYIYYLTTDAKNAFMGTYVTFVEDNKAFDETTGYYTYTFEITFEITKIYKSLIMEDVSFDVSFISNSGNNSYYQKENASFKLNLSKQNFTNIDVNNYLITKSQWANIENSYTTVHTIENETTGILAPGGSSVLQVSVNPDYAYYDYMTLSYSGASVNDALKFELLSQFGSNNENKLRQFAPNKNANIVTIGESLTYRPSQSEKEDANGTLYFRIWVNTTVNTNNVIKLTARFFTGQGEKLSEVNYFLTISYLTEAEITINGEDIAYVARGSIATVTIRLPQDQNINNFSLDGNDSGINISDLSEPIIDEASGIKTYTAQIFVSVTAKTINENNSFSVIATVSRTQNGSTEVKTTSATIKIVDFMIDEENINISNSENNNLDIWLNVPKTFDIEYNFVPETYTGYSTSDIEAVNKVNELLAKRNLFAQNQVYADSTTDFYINYQYDSNQGVKELTIKDRLFFVNGNEFVPAFASDGSANSKVVSFTYDQSKNIINVTGLQKASNIQMVIRTYILSGGNTKIIDTYFTINVEAYSDPDIPLLIENANDFENLNPSLYSSSSNVSEDDYILTNDIILTDFTPFDTSLIRSLDGNGFTIHIKSFNVSYSSSTINLALFTNITENTTLKNVRINIYNGGQLTLDISKFVGQTTINIAGLAIENNGIVTNCEVVAYKSEKLAYGNIENLLEQSTTSHNNPTGFNIKFINGNNTTEEVYVGRESSWTPNIAGFVLNNSGSITNSRVGGESLIELGEEIYNGEIPSGYTSSYTIGLGTFYIVGQGNIAGFVLNNNSAISASGVAKLDIENKSGTSTFTTSGFVNYNGETASISGSFVEGVKSDLPQSNEKRAEDYTREGSSLKSKLGIIAGFIYNNEGVISDSYSNILIANETDSVKVYLASGFVYQNNGTITECYSASQIRNSMYNQMNFSGVDSEGNLLANGQYTNCYYFNKDLYQSVDEFNSTTETQYSTGAVAVKDPADTSYFYGFAIASGDTDGIWRMDEDGPTLIEANQIAYSHRYIYYLSEDSGYEGITGENEQGKYILQYSILQLSDGSREINTALGSTLNPILIVDAQDFVEVMGTSQSTNVQQNYNNSMIWGTYRLVNDIDLSAITDISVLPSANKAFAGKLYGNSFNITGISLTTDSNRVAFGLFSSLETKGSYSPLITNLGLQINQVVGSNSVIVGGLAGYIKDAKLINIDITMSQTGNINGYNFAGTLAGLAFGNNIIKNISITDPNVSTNQYSAISTNNYYDMSNLYSTRNDLKNSLNFSTSVQSSIIINNLSKYSYAGSVIGFVDNYSSESTSFNINQAENYSINNIRVSGIVKIRAEIAGGAFGLTSYQTHLNDVGIDITGSTNNNSSKILSMKYFAGGIIGQSFGSLSRLYVQYNKSTQSSIENNLSSIYSSNSVSGIERGATDLFFDSSTNYSQVYIGGIVGYVGSGKLQISYSKINVISPTAQYAGGIIGGMELDGTTGYNADADLMADSAYTKYFINEVYATGDVRANSTVQSQTNVDSAGIIGVIKGTNPRVALMSVNAFNVFTSYDYTTNTDIALGSITNMSFSLQSNLILGSAFVKNTENNTWTEVNLTETNYSSYLIFVQAKEENLSGGDSTGIKLASVGVYEGYYLINDTYVKLNLFGNISSENSNLFNNNLIYAIQSPFNFTSSAVGSIETRTAFLGSGAWQNQNWVHSTSELFPSIRYQKTSNVIYLDQYNVADVFRMMSGNSDITVIVRGLATEGGTEYGDVNLDEYNNTFTNNQYSPIENFGGRLVGGFYNGNYIKIISSKNFITSVSPGFSVNNLTVNYIGKANNDNNRVIKLTDNQGGLFVAGGIDQANISGLTLNVLSSVEVDFNASSSSIGLVAPTISNTNINNLIVNTGGEGINSISSAEYILTINNSAQNVGLISGSLVQSSSSSIMYVDGIQINTAANFINYNGKNSNVNVGAYFGNVSREKTNNLSSLELRITLQSINKLSTATNNTQYQKISITNVGDKANINIGGFIGKANDINYIGPYLGKDISTSTALHINTTSTGLNINTGLIVGEIVDSSIGQTDFTGANLQGGLFVEQGGINHLNAGGFAGKITNGRIEIRNISKVNFEVVGRETSNNNNQILDINKFDDYSLSNNISPVIVTSANVGGIIGYVNGTDFTLSQNERIYINDKIFNSNNTYLGGDSIQLKQQGATTNNDNNERNNINVGSIIGSAIVPTTASSTQTSKLKILGAITSNANILILKENDTSTADTSTANTADTSTANIGGLVGRILGGINEYNIISKASIQSQSNGLLRYDGAVFSSIKNINFGGVVGNLLNSCDIEIMWTSFGGSLKILGENSNASNVNAGGVIGKFADSQSSNKLTLSIEYTYNYGDVFVQYDNDKFNSLTSYYFGGIVGQIVNTDAVNSITIKNNYSLMTSHNARYIETKQTAHALFGNSTITGNVEGNYYSYAATLTEDKNGTDVSYYNYSTSSYLGYTGGGKETEREENTKLVGIIFDKLNDSDAIASGHKLNPVSIKSDGRLPKDAISFNGIKYYILNNNDIINQLHIEGETINNDKINNIAIIGDSYELNYNNSTVSFIESLNGYSFVSGLVLNVDINDENLVNNTETNLAGVANLMCDNTQIYAVQVKGKINVGGEKAITIGGIVAQMNSGKITNCSTALDLTYRATNTATQKDESGVYGIARLVNSTVSGSSTTTQQNKIIDNVYSTGSVVTYIDINMYAFANGNSQATISNCYSISKIDWNDYTTADKMTSTDTSFNIGVFGGGSSLKNCYYDYNAVDDSIVERDLDEAELKKEKVNTETLMSKDLGIYAESNFDYNYGYPTLKYNFMKLSSYAIVKSIKTGKNKDVKTDTNSIFNNNISSTVYDDYVEEISYERLRNFATTADAGNNSFYFLIPNAGILSIIEKTSTTNFVLLYDIDLSATQFNNNNNNNSWNSLYPEHTETVEGGTVTTGNYSGIFDGNGKTISGLNNTLFNGIQGNSVVKNLRLTDSTINGNPVLAKTITDSIVSNITLSGNITGSSSNLGALTSTLTNSKVYAVTNLTSITLNGLNQNDIGGIVGKMSGGEIKFSSNYGPLSVVLSSDAIADTDYSAVGGLVGSLDANAKIYYSYNSTSVLNGYATSSELSTKKGNYYTGGLVGQSISKTGTLIDHSYNSGMVKSGNKSNGVTNGTTLNGKSYAGGIIGVGNNRNENTIYSIFNCYNEGAVEALGVNAQFAFRWVDTDNNDVTDKLQMYQSSSKNVWAYGIGYYLESEGENNITVIEDENIFENGASANKEDEFSSWGWSYFEDNTTKEFTVSTNKARIFQWESRPPLWDHLILLDHGYNFKLETIVPVPGVTTNCYINAYNSYGEPTSFVVKIEKSVKANKYGAYAESTFVLGVFGLLALIKVMAITESNYETLININDYVAIQYQNSHNYHDQKSKGQEDIGAISRNSIETSLNDLKETTRSANGEERTDYDEIKVAGQSYYLANSNNINNILQAGIYSGVIEIISEDLLYTGDINDYKANVYKTINNENVTIKTTLSNAIQKVEKIVENGISKTKLTVRIFTDDENGLQGDINVSVNCNYSEPLEFDPNDISYVYTDNKSLGIRISGITTNSLLEEESVKIILPNGKESDYKVYKFCVDSTGKGEYIYLYYDEKYEMFVYVPNTNIKTRLGSLKPVNTNTEFDSKQTNWVIETNQLNNIILNGNSYNLTFGSSADEDDGKLTISFNVSKNDNYQSIIEGLKGKINSWGWGDKLSFNDKTESISDETRTITLLYDSQKNADYELKYGNTTIASYKSNSTKQYLIDNLEILTDKFSGKTLYSQQIQGAPVETSITFGGGDSGTFTHNASSGDHTGNVSISYGNEVSSWYNDSEEKSNIIYTSHVSLTIESILSENFGLYLNDNLVAEYNYTEDIQSGEWTISYSGDDYYFSINESNNLEISFTLNNVSLNEITNKISNLKSSLVAKNLQNETIDNAIIMEDNVNKEIIQASHSISFNLGILNADTIILNGNTVLLGYDDSNANPWTTNLSNIQIGEEIYDISIDNSILTFSISSLTEEFNFQDVKDYMASSKAYQNDFSNSVIIDTNIPIETQSYTDTNTKATINFKQYISEIDTDKGIIKQLVENYGNGNYGYELKIDQNNENILNDLTYYEINGIKIYKGVNNFEYTVKTYTQYNSIIISYNQILNGKLNINYIPYGESSQRSVEIDLSAEAEGDMSISYPLSSESGSETPIKATGNMEFSLNINSSYRISSKDVIGDNSSFGIVIKDKDKNERYYVEGQLIDGYNGVEGLINTIYKKYSENSYFYAVKENIDIDNNDGTITQYSTISFYYSEFITEENESLETKNICLFNYDTKTKMFTLIENISGKAYITLTNFNTSEDKLNGYKEKTSNGEFEYYLENGEKINITEKYVVKEDETLIIYDEKPDDKESIKQLVYTKDNKTYLLGDGISNVEEESLVDYYEEDIINSFNSVVSLYDYEKEPISVSSDFIVVNFKYSVENMYEESGYYSSWKTNILQNNYKWTETEFNKYNEVSQNLKIEGSEFNKIELTENDANLFIIDKGSDNELIQIKMLLSDKDKLKDNETISITSKVLDEYSLAGMAENESVTISNKDESPEKDFVSEDGKLLIKIETNGAPLSAQPIIFTQDISIKDFEPVTWNLNINIIGNGYYLSLYNTLFNNVGTSGDNIPFIKDLLILNETYGKSYFVTVESTKQPVMNNLKLYGSVLDYQLDSAALINTRSSMKNIDSYVSINSKYEGNLTLYYSSISTNANNYGTIVALNGKDRESGKNATSYSDSRGAGNNGENGWGINAYKTTETNDNTTATTNINNLGILKVGDGGNGGASGSTWYVMGIDGVSKEGTNNNMDVQSLSIKEEGEGGKKGFISGFANNAQSLGYYGINGEKGAEGRLPFDTVSLKGASFMGIWGSGNNRSIDYLTISNNNKSIQFSQIAGNNVKNNWENVHLSDVEAGDLRSIFDKPITVYQLQSSAKSATNTNNN